MNITRTFDFLYHQLKNAPLEKSFGSRVNGGWKFYSTHEMVELSRQLGHGLLSTGIQKGDKVSIVAYQNIPEYVILDMALAQIGVISIPVYPTISSQEYAFIFDQAEVKVCFVGDGDLYDKVKETGLQLGRPLLIYSFFEWLPTSFHGLLFGPFLQFMWKDSKCLSNTVFLIGSISDWLNNLNGYATVI